MNSIFARGYPQHVVVGQGRPEEMVQSETKQQHCYHSPISHHLIYSTTFNDMLVEFYIRTMTGLKPMLLNHPHLPENISNACDSVRPHHCCHITAVNSPRLSRAVSGASKWFLLSPIVFFFIQQSITPRLDLLRRTQPLASMHAQKAEHAHSAV